VNLLVAARRSLLRAAPPPGRPALLLEGSWPSPDRTGLRDALDDAVDGRFAWIDGEAIKVASALERSDAERSEAVEMESSERFSAAYLNALALRYYLVKLLRPVAYFTELRPLGAGDRIELLAAAGAEDYAEILTEICQAAGAELVVRRVDGPPTPAPAFPPNPRWRRWAGRVAELLSRRFAPRDEAPSRGARRLRTDPRPRVVLCGNPRLLDPVCAELLGCGCREWWLFDRFALKSWLRWRPAGVGQLVCDSSLGEVSRLQVEVPERLECRGINLARPVRRWLSARAETHGPRQTRLVEQIDAHFRRLRPDALVLDEDATPMGRAAVAAARRYGAVSLVVQHGLPCCRFGFAPLAADRFLAWDRPSVERLIAWGLDPLECGDLSPLSGTDASRNHSPPPNPALADTAPVNLGPAHTAVPKAAINRRTPKRVLLLCTTPPRDERPDAVAMNLNRRTYTAMLRAAFSAVAALGEAELIVKLHPRAPDDPTVWKIRKEFPRLRVKIVRRGRLAPWLGRVGCVLSCFSTAGVEAAAAGLPVIQLAPPGAVDVPRAERFGMLGTATDEAELLQLIGDVMRGNREPARVPDPQAFAGPNGSAARIAEEVIGAITLVPTLCVGTQGRDASRPGEGHKAASGCVPTQSVGTSQHSNTLSLQHRNTPLLQSCNSPSLQHSLPLAPP